MDNCVTVTKKVLDLIHVKYTSKYINDSILSHPDHPSLLSISDTLEKYAINNLAVKIELEKLQEIPLPCIVQININRNPFFVVLNSISKKEVSYFNDKDKLIVQSKQDFMSSWTGICLAIETTSNSKEPNIEEKLAAKRILNVLKGSIVLLLLGWILVSFINSEVAESNISYSIAYTMLKLIGLLAAIVLLWFDVDKYNPVLQSFCTGGNKKINCNAVLDSKQAKLFNETISLSLLGFSYFFGSLFYLLIYGFSFAAMSVLGMLSFITLPIIIASIYFQAVVLKQWCKFCIIIQAVLIAEIGVAYFSGFNIMPINPENLFLLLALLLIPILGWKLIKPLIEQEKETNVHKRALKKIKNNPNVLEGLLVKSKKIKTSTEGLGITLLNDTAKHQVIKVCNPYCGPCAKAHPVLEDLVNKGSINLQILFTARADGKDANAKPVSHFLAIEEKGDKKKTQLALDDWYHADRKDYEVFASKYPMNGELEKQNNKIEAMRTWCDAENITHIPTIFINGYELPKEYSIEDLIEVLQ